jgi:glycosyltransferase involved in cell wall biosynthesis
VTYESGKFSCYNRNVMIAPKFSIIIPALNEEAFLPNLLRSLSLQDDKNFEVIVVDGRSKDRTVEVAKTFQKKLPYLSVIVAEKASLPYQRNVGAKQAKGEWFGFIDADTIVAPYFIRRVTSYIDQYHPELLTTWFRPDTEVNGDALLTAFGNLTIEASLSLKRPFSPGPLTMVTKRAFDLVGGYDEEHHYHEDMDFSMRLFKAGIMISLVRETLYIWSLRRMRKQGTLRVISQYIQSALPILFFNTTLKQMPDYIMGGQLYSEKKKVRPTTLKSYEEKLKKIVKEIFE